ncbi:PAS/PAC sensor hybrid histidine kinase [Pseudomonas sp. CFII64]|uniref:ATP-binding protein n=1 Tax=Pseudomonas sp. CFII64 TaxID=911242 RepID=UPI000357D5DD|nr:ATP-binding protein [Pseudomonas sp. CFII64]EPJ84307.1 PAS/PAC sensor hybrid histidine kinase [Pseudomonas sp. CFII64]
MSSASTPVSADIFIGDSAMAQRMRAHDWAATPLGPAEHWPQSLKMALHILLTSKFEMWLGWGDQVHFFYNDAYRPTLGQKDPHALGMPLRELWPEIWLEVKPRIEAVYQQGTATWDQSLLLILHRHEYPEETYHSFSYSPLIGDHGKIQGLFCAVTEDTDRVLNERRLALLRSVASEMAGTRDRTGIFANLQNALSQPSRDLPFSLTFVLDEQGVAILSGSSGFDEHHGDAARQVARLEQSHWNRSGAQRPNRLALLDLTPVSAILPCGAWDQPPAVMAMVPLKGTDPQQLNGFMLIGLNPYRPHDADYLSFIELIAGQVGSSLTRVDVYEAEHRRAEALADALQMRQAAADLLHQANQQLSAEVEQRNQALDEALAQLKKEASEREAIQEALRQSQKMEALGQLTGGIAHDFNNLLTGIIGSLEMISRRSSSGKVADSQRYIDAATQSANRAATLTHRLLAFSRRQPLIPRPTDVNQLMLSMEDILRRSLKEDIRMHLFAHDELWQTLCDPHQLESALLNLVINARDAMPDGGQLTIDIGNVTLARTAIARQVDAVPGDYVCICIRDTGFGMPPDVLAHAFEPFYTTKPQGQGTGLGLSMVYGFVRQSGGYVRIDSIQGQGTEVRLYLRRHDPVEASQNPTSADQSSASVSGFTVLVVEDEQTVRELVLEVLQDFACVTLQAADGLSGLAILESEQTVDLLISDIGLPGLNGRQLADAARVKRPALPILLMTGYAENAALASGFLEEGMQMLTKPFTLAQLTGRIHAMLDCGQAQTAGKP